MATLKQQRAIANLVENGGNVSKAMRDAGYTDATAKTPQKLTESVAYLSIAEQIPDQLLIVTHLEGLEATDGDEPDYSVRHKYLDSAYKLKGSYAAEKHLNLNIDVESTNRTEGLADRLNGLLRR